MRILLLAFVLLLALVVGALGSRPGPARAASLPAVQGTSDFGFGGFISKVQKCECNLTGFLLTISGPFGGEFVLDLSHPPSIQLGSFKMIGGPILGSAGGGASCGLNDTHDGCEDKHSGKVLKWVGGIL